MAGQVATAASYDLVWVLSAIALAVSAIVVLVARRAIRTERPDDHLDDHYPSDDPAPLPAEA